MGKKPKVPPNHLGPYNQLYLLLHHDRQSSILSRHMGHCPRWRTDQFLLALLVLFPPLLRLILNLNRMIHRMKISRYVTHRGNPIRTQISLEARRHLIDLSQISLATRRHMKSLSWKKCCHQPYHHMQLHPPYRLGMLWIKPFTGNNLLLMSMGMGVSTGM
jgi:hypothetical protein